MATPSQTLSSLLSRTTIDDHDEVLKACNAALKKNKNDVDAQHAKAVALVKQDQYAAALGTFEVGGQPIKDQAPLALSYALYKVGRLQEAVDVALGVQNRGGAHVAAQAFYRAEEFIKASEIYDRLQAEKNAREEQEWRINRGALDAQLEWQGEGETVQKKKPGREDLDQYETAFNAACGSIARGELGQADVLLKRAKELCRHSEELPEDEKVTEMLNISVQQLYVLERLGKTEDAEKLASEMKLDDISDKHAKKIAQSNVLSLQAASSSNPFLLKKLFDSAPETTGNDKLFAFQTDIHKANSYAIDLLSRKYDGVARSTTKAISSHPSAKTSYYVTSLSVLNAASKAQGATGKAAIKAILPELERRAKDVGLVIVLVQLYMSANNPSSATDVLESFLKRLNDSVSEEDQEIRHNPGLTAILIALYKSQGRKIQVTNELNKTASYWRQKSKSPPKTLLLAAGKALLNSSSSSASPSELDSAKEIFSTLHTQYPQDREMIAGFIASHALSSPDLTNPLLKSLSPVSDLTAGINVSALEEAGIPPSASSSARKPSIANALTSKPTKRKQPADDHSKSNPTKKRRLPKSRIPKDFVEGKTMDPDRWLPLRERASYRPKKGKKGRREQGGTQGGVVKEESKAEQPAAEVIKGSGGGGGGGQGKKKGKGKKK